MKIRDRKIGIVGAGAMGLGIAMLCAKAGFRVSITDSSVNMLGSVHRRASKYLAHESVRRIMPTNSLRTFEDVDFVIEAVLEELDVKRKVFAELDKICPPHTIFATNTSSILISAIASAVSDERKKKVVGMHFMNPPALVLLLELIAGVHTSRGTMHTTRALARLLKRNPIIKSPDVPGFIVNRLLMIKLSEAVRLVQLGALLEDVNHVFSGVDAGMPIFELADFIGLDICLAISREIAKDKPAFSPGHLLIDLVRNGHLGQKTGKGFFTYESGVPATPKEDTSQETQNYHGMPGGE